LKTDYMVMIAVMHWLTRIILLVEL